METDLFRFLVHDAFCRGDWNDFIVERAGFLSGGRALLALQSELVLLFARNAVSLRHYLGGIKHTHIDIRSGLEHLGICCAIAIVVLVLHQADRFHSATDDDWHVVFEYLFGGNRDRHHARRTLAIDCHSGHRDRQTSCQQRLTRNVLAARPLLHRATHDDIVDFFRRYTCTFHSMTYCVRREGWCLGVIESATIRLANRRTCG